MRHLLAATIAIALLAAADASAKGPTVAQLCGENGCVRITDPHITGLLGGARSAPPQPGEYYRVDFGFDPPGGGARRTRSYVYVPSSNLVAASGPARPVEWYPGRAQEIVGAAAHRLRPFAAPSAWTAVDSAFHPVEPWRTPEPAAGRGYLSLTVPFALLGLGAAAALVITRRRARG